MVTSVASMVTSAASMVTGTASGKKIAPILANLHYNWDENTMWRTPMTRQWETVTDVGDSDLDSEESFVLRDQCHARPTWTWKDIPSWRTLGRGQVGGYLCKWCTLRRKDQLTEIDMYLPGGSHWQCWHCWTHGEHKHKKRCIKFDHFHGDW